MRTKTNVKAGLANISKSQHQTAMAVIGNMR